MRLAARTFEALYERLHQRLRPVFDAKGRRSQPRIWTFFAVTFAWSWTWWLVSVAIKPQSASLATALMFLGSFGPSLAAVLLVANAGGRAGLRAWLGRCLQWPNGWRQGWRWVAFALLFPGAVTAMAAALHIVLSGSIGPSPAAGHGLLAAGNFFLVASGRAVG